MPGTAAKVTVMAQRVEQGCHIHHPDDALDGPGYTFAESSLLQSLSQGTLDDCNKYSGRESKWPSETTLSHLPAGIMAKEFSAKSDCRHAQLNHSNSPIS